jgi:hypothetical protein
MFRSKPDSPLVISPDPTRIEITHTIRVNVDWQTVADCVLAGLLGFIAMGGVL